MNRLTIDEIIEHCKRKVKQFERMYNHKLDYLENEPLDNFTKEYWEHKQVAEYLTELKQYRELEAEDRLLKLPCKIGDDIYEIEVNADACYECKYFDQSFRSEPDGYCTNPEVSTRDGKKYPTGPAWDYGYPLCEKQFYEVIRYRMDDIGMICRRMDAVGKTAFLTREEAEEKMKELREQNEK